MRRLNPDVANIINCFEERLKSSALVWVDDEKIKQQGRIMAGIGLTTPNWKRTGALPKDHRAFISHTFYINVINFAFRHFGGSGRNYVFNRRYRGSMGGAACFYRRFGERAIVPADILSITATLNRTKEFLKGKNSMPLLSERRAMLAEAAMVLRGGFAGDPSNLLEESRYDAGQLVRLLVDFFPRAYGQDYSFCDLPNGWRTVLFFNKRAQLWPMIYHGRALHSRRALKPLANPEYFGPIADTAVPNALRCLGFMGYAPELADKINRGVELAAGGGEELAIRMATVYAAQKLLEDINHYLVLAHQPPITMVELDYYLWQFGKASGLPPHLCRTTAY